MIYELLRPSCLLALYCWTGRIKYMDNQSKIIVVFLTGSNRVKGNQRPCPLNGIYIHFIR